MESEKEQKAGKAEARQIISAGWYAARLVLRLRPKLFALSIGNEFISATVPFVDAYFSAKIVTLLPQLVDLSRRTEALHAIFVYLLILLIVRVVDTVQRDLFSLYHRRQDMELNSLITGRLNEKFAQLPYGKYEEKAVIDQYELARTYAGRLSDFVLYKLRDFAGSIYTLTLAAIAIVHFSWPLALLLALFAVPKLLLEFRVNREQRKTWRDTTVDRRKAYTFEDLLRPQAIKDTRLFGLASYAIKHALSYGARAQSQEIAIERKAEKYRFGLNLVDTTADTGVLAYVIYQIYRGVQPLGQFVFIQQIMMQYTSALASLVRTVQDFDEYLAGATEFHAFMRLPELRPGKLDFEVTDIKLSHVSFAYPTSKQQSLKDITLTIPHGKTIAIVGENGAGKTTLVKLLMKLYDPSAGYITMGGSSLAEIDEHAWHSNLGVLFQDFVSFNDFTIRENVQFGRISDISARKDNTKADDMLVVHALKQAGAYEFVQALPKGLDTYLGTYMDETNGTWLSGGQLQRLAIARVLYRNPKVLIMDEPTSAVDAKAEYQIFLELEKARRGKTTILISHRFSTVRKAEHIFVLHKGRLAEQGTHQELLALNGHYAALFNSQAEGYR